MSNSNYSLKLTATASYKGQDIEFEFDPYNDCSDMEGLKEMAELEIETSEDFEVEPDGIETDEISVKITDYDEVPAEYADEDNVWDFAAAFAECNYEIDVVLAAFECGVSAKDIDEAYSGSFKDDEEFAEDMAEQVGAIDRDAKWPQTCIDWEQAARELMMDYSEHNGHYFRNF